MEHFSHLNRFPIYSSCEYFVTFPTWYTSLFSLYIYDFLLTIFSTCFGPAGLSSWESNYTRSLWSLSLVRWYVVRGRWC